MVHNAFQRQKTTLIQTGTHNILNAINTRAMAGNIILLMKRKVEKIECKHKRYYL